jgi:hypothetical protein
LVGFDRGTLMRDVKKRDSTAPAGKKSLAFGGPLRRGSRRRQRLISGPGSERGFHSCVGSSGTVLRA